MPAGETAGQGPFVGQVALDFLHFVGSEAAVEEQHFGDHGLARGLNGGSIAPHSGGNGHWAVGGGGDGAGVGQGVSLGAVAEESAGAATVYEGEYVRIVYPCVVHVAVVASGCAADGHPHAVGIVSSFAQLPALVVLAVLGDQNSPTTHVVAIRDDEQSHLFPSVEEGGILNQHAVVAAVELKGGLAVEAGCKVLRLAVGGRLISSGEIIVATAVTPIADGVVVGGRGSGIGEGGSLVHGAGVVGI